MRLSKTIITLSIIYNVTSVCAFIANSDNETVNPEVFLNTTQILQKHNYLAKSYKIVTKDGYHLNLVRIVNTGPPILLVHGFSESSDSWVVQGPQHSLACKLNDIGYDIWIFNARGNRYSKGHSENLNAEKYWNFSYEEIGTFDLPATIDFILTETLQKKVTFIGFSQGTTAFFVLCSLKPQYNYKINHAILLAPVAWFNNVTHPILNILSSNIDIVKSVTIEQNVYKLFSSNKQSKLYHARVCNISSPENWLCAIEEYLLAGLENLTKLLPERLPIIASHLSAGISTKTLLHFLQGYASKKFQRFDRGFRRNRQIYFSSTPPEYDVSQINVPMTIFYSEVDWFTSSESIKQLQRKLKAQYKLILINKSLGFSHLEFVYGTRVMSLVNKPIINIVKSLTNSNFQ